MSGITFASTRFLTTRFTTAATAPSAGGLGRARLRTVATSARVGGPVSTKWNVAFTPFSRRKATTKSDMDYLSKLENQSIYIMREAFNKFEHLAMLWSIGKDSTVLLWLARKAFFGHVPFPLVHVDTTYKIPSMIEYRDRLVKERNLELVVG